MMTENDKLKVAEQLFLSCKLEEAFEIFMELANKNNSRALYFLGELYYDNENGLTNDRDAACDCWRQGLENKLCAYRLIKYLKVDLHKDYLRIENRRGTRYEEIIPIFINLINDVYELAEKGDIFAQYEIAEYLLYLYRYSSTHSDTGVDRAFCKEKGISFAKNAAEAGYWNAQCLLFLENNLLFGEKNLKEAEEWLCKAAEKGYARAQSILGIQCYRKKDYANFVKWTKKAVEKNLARAQYNLGQEYVYGEVIEQDIPKGVKLLINAAKQGHLNAQKRLAIIYEGGINGISPNLEESIKWLTKAAEQGDSFSQCQLGIRYANGILGERDFIKGLEWIHKAVRQGDEHAKKTLERIYKDKNAIAYIRKKQIPGFNPEIDRVMSSGDGNQQWRWRTIDEPKPDFDMENL